MMEDKDRARHEGLGTVINGERLGEVWQGMRDMGPWQSRDGSIGTGKWGERDAGDVSMDMGKDMRVHMRCKGTCETWGMWGQWMTQVWAWHACG